VAENTRTARAEWWCAQKWKVTVRPIGPFTRIRSGCR
jgi:hypothetical protein